MTIDIKQLKKDYKTAHLAEAYEQLLSEEEQAKKMLEGDESLRDIVEEELKSIKTRGEGLEKQIEDILKAEQEAIEAGLIQRDGP